MAAACRLRQAADVRLSNLERVPLLVKADRAGLWRVSGSSSPAGAYGAVPDGTA
jgi:hypothetical protein